MKILDYWEFWVIVYLISALIFAQSFKKANRNMKNASLLTVLLELSAAFFATFFIWMFPLKISTDYNIYLTLLLVVIIYAVTDRLNIEARYGLEPSTFSMLKQLSTVFMILFGFIFLKEQVILTKVIGVLIIIFANLILTFENGKLKINKYFIMSFISNFLFAVAMLINVDIAINFNLAIYTILTVLVPSLIIFIAGRFKVKDLIEEWKLYDKKKFLLSAFTWCLMLISSVRAYQLGSVTVVASLFSLTSILNAVIEFIFNKNSKKFMQKIIAALLVLIGVVLVRI